MALFVAVPSAGAANCGKQLINEYFFTGRLKYHTQECYASALKQVDPDARMYSGIMGAIRAARARDSAKDRTPADSGADTTAADTTPIAPQPVTPTETLPLTNEIVPTEPALPTLPPQSTDVVSLPAAQAAEIAAAADSGVPLSVTILAGLAVLLTLVGLGGLAVRWLDRGY